ncbi:D-alanine--D-alanine ligase [soil metagenome]
MHGGRIVILHDPIPSNAAPDEQDGLRQVEVAGTALCTLGYTTQRAVFDENLPAARARLAALAPRLVFNLVESRAGRGHLIHLAPAVLEDIGVPFTGTPQAGMFLSSHKLLAKHWLELHECPTPPAVTDPARAGDGPWIVKSVWEDASFGLDDDSVVDDPAGLVAQVAQRRAALGGHWFAERYVAGREFNVSLLEQAKGCRVLPVAEIRFDDYPEHMPRIVGYRAKWAVDSFEHAHTERRFGTCTAAQREEMSRLALRCWDIFGMRGYARVDFRIDEHDRPWILEVNANPCLAEDAGFAAALAEADISLTDAVGAIAAAATSASRDSL